MLISFNSFLKAVMLSWHHAGAVVLGFGVWTEEVLSPERLQLEATYVVVLPAALAGLESCGKDGR